MPSTKPLSPKEVALQEAQNLMQLWIRTKSFLLKAISEQPITREDEQAFLETKSDISRYQRVLGPKLPEDADFGASRMQELLRQSISIGHLRGLPKSDKQNLLTAWHHVFIRLSRATGALQFVVEGYVPPPRKAKATGNISEMKGAAGAEKKKKKKPPFAKILKAVYIFGGIIAAGLVIYLLVTTGLLEALLQFVSDTLSFIIP